MHWVRAYTIALCLFSFFAHGAQSIIIESSTLNEINHHIPQNKQQTILIIVDLDETIITNTTALGTTPWSDTVLKKLIAHGFVPTYARTLMRSLYINVQKHSKLRLIEEHTPSLIAQWQAQGIHVIALTARAARLAEHTAQQLRAFGITFTDHAPAIPATRKYLFSFPQHACHHNGVVCCGPHNKGTILNHWLNIVDLKPDLIIFADDKHKNIHDVQQIAEQRSIAFVGIRYSRCDQEIKNFNFTPTIAELQKLYDTHPEIERLPVAVAA